MNKKYVMVGVLAFSEEKDMNKLKKYAPEGTKPIYSHKETEVDKYTRTKK